MLTGYRISTPTLNGLYCGFNVLARIWPLYMPYAVRTLVLPFPKTSQARPTLGENSFVALFVVNAELEITGFVSRTPVESAM